MNIINFILAIFSLASLLGTVAASFYGVRQKTIIATLEASNKAYTERNNQLEDELKRTRDENSKEIAVLGARISALERIKTPPLKPLMEMVQHNHTEVMKALGASHD